MPCLSGHAILNLISLPALMDKAFSACCVLLQLQTHAVVVTQLVGCYTLMAMRLVT